MGNGALVGKELGPRAVTVPGREQASTETDGPGRVRGGTVQPPAILPHLTLVPFSLNPEQVEKWHLDGGFRLWAAFLTVSGC